MEISRQDLEERFRALSDQALVDKVNAGTLTPVALEIALHELRSRGIEAAADAEATEEHDDFAAPRADDEFAELAPDVDLVTVARLSSALEANILRACLESHGIFAFVWGEHLGSAHLVLSSASGGVRVQVREDQVQQAKAVIAAFERGDLAIDEEQE